MPPELGLDPRVQPAVTTTWDDITAITGKIPGRYTWPTQAVVNLCEQGYAVELITAFDFEAFAESGVDYLKDAFGRKVAKIQAKNSDISYEQEYILNLIKNKKARLIRRIPTLQDVQSYLENGYLVGSWINGRTLNGRRGYEGHFVLVYGMEGDKVHLHDPGQPAHHAMVLATEKFLTACTTPSPASWYIMAIKYTG